MDCGVSGDCVWANSVLAMEGLRDSGACRLGGCRALGHNSRLGVQAAANGMSFHFSAH